MYESQPHPGHILHADVYSYMAGWLGVAAGGSWTLGGLNIHSRPTTARPLTYRLKPYRPAPLPNMETRRHRPPPSAIRFGSPACFIGSKSWDWEIWGVKVLSGAHVWTRSAGAHSSRRFGVRCKIFAATWDETTKVYKLHPPIEQRSTCSVGFHVHSSPHPNEWDLLIHLRLVPSVCVPCSGASTRRRVR